MKKLSNAQAKVIEQAKKDIDYARTHDFIHWISKSHGYDLDENWDEYPNPYLTNESVLEKANELVKTSSEWWKKTYENTKNGFVRTSCNSRTLAKLAEYGLIEIISDSKGHVYGIDEVKVLNY